MQKWNAWHSFFLVLESDMEVVTHQFDPLWLLLNVKVSDTILIRALLITT